MKKLNQKAFAVVEIVIALIVLAAIGSVGYYVYQNRADDSQNESVEIPAENRKDQNEETEKAVNTPVSPDVRLKEFYADYTLNYTESSEAVINGYKTKGYIHPEFPFTATEEPVYCGNEMLPDSVNVKIVDQKSDVTVLDVQKIYTDGSGASNSIVAEMKLNDANQWALSKITCTTTN